MPMYDRECNACHTRKIDCLEPIKKENPTCDCGGALERIFTVSTIGTFQDEIPGGIYVRHGICNPDGSPRRFDSKSEMRRAAKAKGLVNLVEHVPNPTSGSDKSKHTQRWI